MGPLNLGCVGHAVRRRRGSFLFLGEVGDLVFSFHDGSLQSGGITESKVRKGGLEPPRIAPLDPKSSASTNSATSALPKISELGAQIATRE